MEMERIEEKKKIILDILAGEFYVPMKIKELAIVLNVPKNNREELAYVVNLLESEGKLVITKKGKIMLPEKLGKVEEKMEADLIEGVFESNQRGFGFVRMEDGDDIFVPESQVHGALHTDKVLVKITSKSKDDTNLKREGEIVKVLERGFEEIVGIFKKSKSFGFVISDNTKFTKDIYIPVERSKGAVTGHKVVVKITDFGGKNKKPEGIVKKIIGHVNDPGTDILSVVESFNIPMEYPKDVLEQIEDMPEEVPAKDKAGRLDLTGIQMVTIDGEDAKDLDDAISLSKENGIYKLGVHIADVSNYVTENSPLDREALKRGTSVYLVDRVIPMLPHKLSNGLCSLNAGVDRLALSCIMEIDEKGKVIGHKIAETVVNIDKRMTYTAVNKILSLNDEEAIKEYEELVPMFKLMEELAAILREKRRNRGSIDFDFPESKIYLDEKGFPTDILPYERNVATKIIEDFMLIANETVAEDFFWQELPFVYRTHDNPDPEKMLKLGTFISNFGYGIKTSGNEVHPKELQKLLDRIAGSPEEALISRLTLRSMKQAKYTTVSTGHFGLATQYYCHFTSPIRRYPDLQIHRIIKENLRGKLSEKRIRHYENILPEVSQEASRLERRAEEAERDVEKMKKVQYMSRRIGEEYEGVISGITAYGMYVELPNTVEGMVHVSNMRDDYYHYDGDHYEMVGEKTGNVYRLGQKVRILVENTDKINRTIDFSIVI
ncbi:MAG: ribonuclease R [Lachnospiraceae bacterium]|nr:ribonuclease R [Lachnospiraceae bacterium]